MSDDVLERVRMCVAEAGYDSDAVRRPPGVDWTDPSQIEFITRLDLPDDVYWRARELSGVSGPMCRRCCVEPAEQYLTHPRCHSAVRFTEDCGIAR